MQSTTTAQKTKQQLFDHCLAYAKNHRAICSTALANAVEGANEESKNTAGDKYETGRAMLQLETEACARRLDEAAEQHAFLKTISVSNQLTCVENGALVRTTLGNFFISISADELIIDGEEYCPISMESPIGQAIRGRKAGESTYFRGKPVSVLSVY